MIGQTVRADIGPLKVQGVQYCQNTRISNKSQRQINIHGVSTDLSAAAAAQVDVIDEADIPTTISTPDVSTGTDLPIPDVTAGADLPAPPTEALSKTEQMLQRLKSSSQYDQLTSQGPSSVKPAAPNASAPDFTPPKFSMDDFDQLLGNLKNEVAGLGDKLTDSVESAKTGALSVTKSLNELSEQAKGGIQGASGSIGDLKEKLTDVQSFNDAASLAKDAAGSQLSALTQETSAALDKLITESTTLTNTQIAQLMDSIPPQTKENILSIWGVVQEYAPTVAATAGIAAAIVMYLRIKKFEGYSGDLTPDSALTILQDASYDALLLDIRPEIELENQGIVSLKRQALGKGAWVPTVELSRKVAGRVGDKEHLKYDMQAVCATGLKQVSLSTQFIVMSRGEEHTRELARAIQRTGYPAYVLQGGFSAWDSAGLPVNTESADYSVSGGDVLRDRVEVVEERVVAVTDRVKERAIEVGEFLADPANILATVGVFAGTGLAVYNYEKLLIYIGVLGPIYSLLNLSQKYDSAEEITADIRTLYQDASDALRGERVTPRKAVEAVPLGSSKDVFARDDDTQDKEDFTVIPPEASVLIPFDEEIESGTTKVDQKAAGKEEKESEPKPGTTTVGKDTGKAAGGKATAGGADAASEGVKSGKEGAKKGQSGSNNIQPGTVMVKMVDGDQKGGEQKGGEGDVGGTGKVYVDSQAIGEVINGQLSNGNTSSSGSD